MAQEIHLKVHTSGTGVKTVVSARSHHLLIDESPAMGGNDAGPNPLEYVLAALAGCEEVIAQGAAKQLGFQLDGIDFDVEGVIDPRGLMGQPDVNPYFQRITIWARVKTTESDERIRALQELVDARCPVFTLIRAAGVPVDTQWVKAYGGTKIWTHRECGICCIRINLSLRNTLRTQQGGRGTVDSSIGQ